MTKLTESIENSGLKRFHICKKLEISKSTLLRWERQENMDSIKNFIKLAKIINVDTGEIEKLVEE